MLCIEKRCPQSPLDALMPRKGTNEDTRGRTCRLCLLFFSLCLFVIGFAGCHRSWSTGDVRIEPEFEPNPPRVGAVTITLRVTEALGKPVTGARLKLELNMTHAGMAPVIADAQEVEPGSYRANVQLSMAGDWSLFVDVTLANGNKVYQSFDIKGVSSA